MMNGGRNSARSRREGRPWVSVIAQRDEQRAHRVGDEDRQVHRRPGAWVGDLRRRAARGRASSATPLSMVTSAMLTAALTPTTRCWISDDHHRQAAGEEQHERRGEGEPDDEGRLGQRDGEGLPADLDVGLRALQHDERRPPARPRARRTSTRLREPSGVRAQAAAPRGRSRRRRGRRGARQGAGRRQIDVPARLVLHLGWRHTPPSGGAGKAGAGSSSEGPVYPGLQHRLETKSHPFGLPSK